MTPISALEKLQLMHWDKHQAWRVNKVLFESTLREKEQFVLAQVIESYGKVCKHWKLNLSPEDSVLSAARGVVKLSDGCARRC